jgi:hypothetical protein
LCRESNGRDINKRQETGGDTKNAMINWKPANVKHQADSTTVEEPPDLGDGPGFIDLTKKEAEIVASLAYDPKEREFPPKEEEDQNDPYGLRNRTGHRQPLRRYQAVKGVGAIALVTHAY